ncbi:hypothetical protein [Rhodopila sp.]|uniref:hypothetical protein n=1 Tax=Rhodopila sp. TaxID=2480087 RepID=UPI003D0BC144
MQGQADRIPLAILPLLRALGDLKRVHSASRNGSIAERLFAEGWSRLVAGEDALTLVFSIVSDSLIAVRLGDLDAQTLGKAGIPGREITRIRRRALNLAAEPLDDTLRIRLLDSAVAQDTAGAPPPFVMRLAAQPRAGATCPGRGRLILEPPENHAEHCAVVAIYGVLLAPVWNARPEDVFLAGLAHHLHNALLPDAGYAGEVLLGDWLQSATANATRLALRELPAAVRTRVEAACRILPDAESPEGCAFHAADTLDRVLQLEHHLRASNTTMDFVLREMELVHAGPVKPYQDAVLARMGLAA